MELDLTGGKVENRLTSTIPINYNGGRIAIVTPQLGFFHTSMSSPVVMYNGETLKHGTDYRYAYKSKDIRSKYNVSAHGSIVLVRPGLKGQIELTASYLGGTYRLYKTDYASYISSTDYLLSLYDITNLMDLPDDLPPTATLLDMESITGGMTSSVQLMYSIGYYLKHYEDGLPEPSNGAWWPELDIVDRLPPIEITATLGSMSDGMVIPDENLATARIGLIGIGCLPIGMYSTIVERYKVEKFYPRMDIGVSIDGVPLDYADVTITDILNV